LAALIACADALSSAAITILTASPAIYARSAFARCSSFLNRLAASRKLTA
jgi:hypothetical protein